MGGEGLDVRFSDRFFVDYYPPTLYKSGERGLFSFRASPFSGESLLYCQGFRQIST
jgi:hypothetical protein